MRPWLLPGLLPGGQCSGCEEEHHPLGLGYGCEQRVRCSWAAGGGCGQVDAHLQGGGGQGPGMGAFDNGLGTSGPGNILGLLPRNGGLLASM